MIMMREIPPGYDRIAPILIYQRKRGGRVVVVVFVVAPETTQFGRLSLVTCVCVCGVCVCVCVCVCVYYRR